MRSKSREVPTGCVHQDEGKKAVPAQTLQACLRHLNRQPAVSPRTRPICFWLEANKDTEEECQYVPCSSRHTSMLLPLRLCLAAHTLAKRAMTC